MYDILYYLVEHREIDNLSNNYSSCDISAKYYFPKIYETFINISLNKYVLYQYINNMEDKEKYQIREFRLNDYCYLFENKYLYIIFNNKFDKGYTSNNEIYITDILFDYTNFEQTLKDKTDISAIKCEISEVNCIFGHHPVKVFEVHPTRRKYHVEYTKYNELENAPVTKFLHLNNKKIKFLHESDEEYSARIQLNEEYFLKQQQIINKKNKIKIEQENNRKRKIIEKKEETLRVQKFLKLSKEQQEKVLSSYEK